MRGKTEPVFGADNELLSASPASSSHLRRSPTGPSASAATGGQRRSSKGKTSFTLKIFELQRRTTVFQQDWRAPFLPHDQLRAHCWRWVDVAFHRHPWLSAGSIQQAASADVPPIKPGGNWVALGDWKVADSDDVETDSDGWQYSNNFYRWNSLWYSTPRACHVRRRLWLCEFTEQDPNLGSMLQENMDSVVKTF